MRKELRDRYLKPAIWVLWGFLMGAGMARYWVQQEMSDISDIFETSSVADTNMGLAYARLLRDGEEEYLIEQYESRIETAVLIFTNDGKGIESLSENDRCVFDQVRNYWEKECKKQCFEKLTAIFANPSIRVTSACSSPPSVAGPA